jgi:uncharacterized protein (TIGR00645 family)
MEKKINKVESKFEFLIFWSRWTQAPMYGGLVIASILFTYKFAIELLHLITDINVAPEEKIMLMILTLIDMVMVSNVLLMIIIGGYATFVSKLNIGNHEDRPAWLQSMDPGTLKVKLSASLVGVSGVHLLKGFVNVDNLDEHHLMWQSILHLIFLASAIGLAYSEKIMHSVHSEEH